MSWLRKLMFWRKKPAPTPPAVPKPEPVPVNEALFSKDPFGDYVTLEDTMIWLNQRWLRIGSLHDTKLRRKLQEDIGKAYTSAYEAFHESYATKDGNRGLKVETVFPLNQEPHLKWAAGSWQGNVVFSDEPFFHELVNPWRNFE